MRRRTKFLKTSSGAFVWNPNSGSNLVWRLCPRLDGVANGYQYPALIDQSGNGYNSDTQATTSKRASYVSTGGPVTGYADFNGNNSYLMRTTIPTFTVASMLLVLRVTSAATIGQYDSIINTRFSGVSGNIWFSFNNATTGINRLNGSTWVFAEANGSDVTTEINQLFSSYGYLYPRDEWFYIYTKGGTTTATGFDICTDNGTRESPIQIAEICVWNSDLNAGEEASMRNYLNNTNGLPTS